MSNKTSHHGLAFAVTPLNKTAQVNNFDTVYLGSAATLGQTFVYEIRLENILEDRNQKEIEIRIRPPTCL